MDRAVASMDDLLSEFLDETTERLARIESGLATLSDDPDDPAVLADIHVLLRTITGTSGFLELPELESLAQSADTVVERVREGEISLNAEVCALVAKAIDHIKLVLHYLEKHEVEPGHDHLQLIADLAHLAEFGEMPSSPDTGGFLVQDNTLGGMEPLNEAAVPTHPVETAESDNAIPVKPGLLRNLLRMVSELVVTRNRLVSVLHDRQDSDVAEPLQHLTDLTKDLRLGILEAGPEPAVSALVVESGGLNFAIPRDDIVEIADTGSDTLLGDDGTSDLPAPRLEVQDLSIVNVAGVLDLPAGRPEPRQRPGPVVVVRNGEERLGLGVDRVCGFETMPLSPLPPLIQSIPYYRGITVLDSARAAMVLETRAFAPSENLETPENTGPVSSRPAAFLLCRGGVVPAIAVPLDRIQRFEEVVFSDVTFDETGMRVDYHGTSLPLVPVDPAIRLSRESRKPVLVIAQGAQRIGLVVDEVSDIVDTRIALQPSSSRAGFLGQANVDGVETGILDCSYFLEQSVLLAASEAAAAEVSLPARKHLLLVDGSTYIRNLLSPVLAGAGYEVVTADSMSSALQICGDARHLDGILCATELPDGSGFDFVETLRADGRWVGVPVVAVSAHGTGDMPRRTLDGGFSDCVGKYNRDGLLQALSELL